MNTISLFEHDSILYTEFDEGLRERILSDLESLNQAAGAELFRLGRRQLTATQFVGVVQLTDIAIEVLPKIDTDHTVAADPAPGSPDHSRAVESAARNLLHLLSYTHGIRFHREDIAHLETRRSAWLELLTAIFASNLHRLLQRGLVRSYVRIEESLPLIRGRWLAAQQLARRPHVRHAFDLQYDEFSPDNPLNRVFKYVVNALLRLTRSPANRTLLLDLDAWLSEVATPSGPPLRELEAVTFTRLNEHFRPAFNLARMFIENSIVQLSAGRRQAFAFLFDMNILFEKFVAGFLLRHQAQIFAAFSEPIYLRDQSRKRAQYLAHKVPDGSARFRLKPDLLLEDSRRIPIMILDTKYKSLDPKDRNEGVSQNDIYQMLAYSLAYKCPTTLLLYPLTAVSPEFLEFLLVDSERRLFAAALNLRQPLENPQVLILRFRQILETIQPSEMPDRALSIEKG